MSDTTEGLRRKISNAGDLQSVVRTMKALAASSIGQYEKSVRALADYDRTVKLGLGTCLRESEPLAPSSKRKAKPDAGAIGAVVFGSDQGLVGQFNDVIADLAIKTLSTLPGKAHVWAVGERVHARLADARVPLIGLFTVPNSVQAITPLVGQIQIESEAHRAKGEYAQLYVFHLRPKSGALYEPVGQRLLPLDAPWADDLAKIRWPTATLPEVMGSGTATMRALIREYLFISLFRACAESLASENASRLAAMQRAEKNIDDLLETFQRSFQSLRQSGIDEELFDVISGFEALSSQGGTPGGQARAKKPPPPKPSKRRAEFRAREFAPDPCGLRFNANPHSLRHPTSSLRSGNFPADCVAESLEADRHNWRRPDQVRPTQAESPYPALGPN